MFRSRSGDKERGNLLRSKFGSIFRRNRIPKAVPADLEEVSVAKKNEDMQYQVHALPTVSTVRVSEESSFVSSQFLEARRDVRSPLSFETNSNQSLVTRQTSPLNFEHDNQSQRSHGRLSQSTSSDSPAEVVMSHDLARSAHSNMLEAFTDAIYKNRKSKLGTLAMTSPMLEETYAYKTIEATALAPSLVRETNTLTIAEVRPELPSHAKSETRLESPLPSLKRSDSSPQLSHLTSISQRLYEREKYSSMSLPTRPQQTKATHFTTGIRHKKLKVTRRTLESQKRQKLGQSLEATTWTGSCPNLEEARPEVQNMLQSHSNNLFGAQIILYWLCGGRRFFDKECEERLSHAGSACLCVENEVFNFTLHYPLATLTSFKSGFASYDNNKSPRYVSLPYADNSFDVVSARALSLSVLAVHWPATLKELKRVLKPGGILEACFYDTRWINAGDRTRVQESTFLDGLRASGYPADPLQEICELLQATEFSSVITCHLAIPVGWGGRVARVYAKFMEPLRAVREDRSHCSWSSLDATPEKRWARIKNEVVANRSSRGIVICSATK